MTPHDQTALLSSNLAQMTSNHYWQIDPPIGNQLGERTDVSKVAFGIDKWSMRMIHLGDCNDFFWCPVNTIKCTHGTEQDVYYPSTWYSSKGHGFGR
jgi:hypothetical protein